MREWIVGCGVLLAFVVFESFMERNAWWLRFVFLTVAMIGLASRSRSELATEGSFRLAEVVEDAPWLKAWACVWAAAIAVAAYYVTRHSLDLSSLGLFRVILVPLAMIVAPFVIVIERQKFNDLGELDDAS